MRFLNIAVRLVPYFCFAVCAVAQNVPRPPATMEISGYDARGSVLPAGASSTLLPFTLEADTAGENAFHVVVNHPAIVVSLILPSGTEVTSSNATGLGFTFVSVPSAAAGEILSVFSMPGTHYLIQVPSGQVSGTYSIKANTVSVSTESAILASYYASSKVRTAVTTNSSTYKVGDTVVLSGLVWDAATPITGATVAAAVSASVSVTGQASVTNPQLVSQQSVGTNLTEYEYSFSLLNSGAAIREAQAALVNVPAGVSVVNDVLLFGDVDAAATIPSLSRLVIRRDPSLTFSPSTLQWEISATGPLATVGLVDSGSLDAAPGDGIYTGTFIPTAAGTYTTVLSVTGTSLSGNSFSRTAIASFEVTAQPLASFTGFSDSQQSTGIVVTANVNVVTAGTYLFSVDLQASNQAGVRRSTSATLSAGTQQISVSFPNVDVFGLGVSGPYERVKALLVFNEAPRSLVADGNADAGPTAAYTLSSFAPPVYFTGQNSAAGLDTGGFGSFDVLRVQIGAYAPAGTCTWGGTLTDSNGTALDSVNGGGALVAGANTIVLDFSGEKIAQFGANGPYLVSRVGVTCATGKASADPLFQTPSFAASQFRYVAPGLSLSVDQATLSILAGNFGLTKVSIATSGGSNGSANFQVSGLPSGVTANFTGASPGVIVPGSTYFILSVGSNAAGAVYPLTVTATSGSLTASVNVTLAVLVPDFTISVSPSSMSVAPTSQVNTTLTITPANTFNGTVTLSASGLPTGAVASFLPSNVSGASPSNSTLNIATNAVAPGSYPFTITGTSGTLTHNIPATLVVDASVLPYPWLTQGIGAGATGGAATHTSGTFSITGPGNSLSSTADSFQFTYQPLNGDGTLIARISQLQNAAGVSMAGITIREALDPGAKDIFLGLTAGNTINVQSRISPGGSYTSNTFGAQNAPVWLKLARAANAFTAFTSPDGLHWTQQGSAVTVTMASSVFAGLALCSNTSGPTASGVFDHSLVATGADFYLSDVQPLSRTAAPNVPTATFAVTVVPLSTFTGTATMSAVGLPSGSTASFSASSIVGSGGTLLTVNAASVAAGTYFFYLAGTNGSAVRFTPATLIVSSTNVSGPADPWSAQDIGAGAPGTGTSYSNGVYTVSGSGQSITTGSDAFRFEHQPLVGDGTILARIVSVQNEQSSSRFGVMLRDNLGADSTYAAMMISNNSGDQFNLLGRAAAGGTPVNETGGAAVLPAWVKLVRAGSSFTGFASSDGVNWAQVGTARTIAMGAILFAGIAVNSGNASQVAVVTFDNVTISSGADFYLLSSPPSRTIPVGAAVYYHTIKMLALNGSFGSANLSVSGLPTGVTATLPDSSLSPGGFTNLKFSVTASAAPGTYPVSVTGTSGAISHSVIINLTISASGTPLPTPWAADDIGQPAIPGSSSISASGAVIQATGAFLTGTSDSFRYTYQALTGDGTLLIRNYLWTTIHDNASNGIMIRESLLPDAAYAYARLRADVLVGTLLNEYGGFQYRPAAGASITMSEAGVGTNPSWLKIVRSGNVFSGFTSPDGVSWTQRGASVTINMPSTVFIGYAVTAASNNDLTTAYFDSTLLVQGPDFGVATGSVSRTVPQGRGIAYYTPSVVSYNNFSGSVALSVTGLPAGATATFAPPTISGSGASTLQIVTAPSVLAGTYTVQVVGTSSAVNRSAPITLVVDGAQTTPAAPWQYDFVGTGLPTDIFSATANNGVFTLSGGAATDTAKDAGVFVHQTLATDGTMVMRLNSLGDTTAGASIMIRQGLAPGAPYAALRLTNPNGIAQYTLESRATANGAVTTALTGSALQASSTDPYSFKLVRQGTAIIGYLSPDGSQWIRLSPPLTWNVSGAVEVGIQANGGGVFDKITASASSEYLISVFPPYAHAMDGSSASFHVTAFPSLNAGSGTPAFSVTGLPSGVTATFTPAILDSTTSSADLNTTTLILTAAAGVPQGTYPITVTATNGSVNGSAIVNLKVMPGFHLSWAKSGIGGIHETPAGWYGPPHPASGFNFSQGWAVTVTFVGGYANPVSFDARTDLSSLTPLIVNGTLSSTADNGFTVKGDATAQSIGLHSSLFIAIPSDSNPVQSLLVPMEIGPDFSVCCQGSFPSTIVAGGNTPSTLNVSRSAGHSDAITLSTSGLPSGITVGFDTNPVPSSTTTVNMTTAATASTTPGSYTGRFTATSASVTHTFEWPTPLSVQGFSIGITPPTAAVAPGGNTTYTGTLGFLNGFVGTVSFAVNGLPSGASVTFTPPTRNNPGTTAVKITAGASTPVGTYSLTLTATSGSAVQSVPFTFQVATDFSITTSASTVTVTAGTNGTNTITITPGTGFTQPVTLSVSGLPSGASGGFATNPVPNGSGTSVLTVSTTAAAVGGNYTVTVTGTAGTLVHTKTFTLTIRNFSLTVSPAPLTLAAGATTSNAYTVTMAVAGGFNSTVTFTKSTLPSGVTASFSPPTLNAAGTTALTVATTTGVTPGTYPFTITGTSGSLVQSISATLVVNPGFVLTNSGNKTISASPTATGTVTITLAATSGLSGPTSFAASGLPTNATAAFNPTTVTGSGTTTMTITVPSSVVGGTSTVTVTGTNGSVTRTTTFTLTVQNFTLAAAPSTLTVTHGGANVTSTVTLTMTGGFATTVGFSATNLPTGVTVTFNPTSKPSTGTTTATIHATSGATLGNRTINFVGTAGTLVQSIPISLTVN